MRIVFALFIAFSILRGYLAFASVKMLPRKKKRPCPFSSSKPRAKKKSNGPQNFISLEELDIQKSENAAVAESASRSKIHLEEPDEERQF